MLSLIGTWVGMNKLLSYAIGALAFFVIIGGIWTHGLVTGRAQIHDKIQASNMEAMENRSDVENRTDSLSDKHLRDELHLDAIRE